MAEELIWRDALSYREGVFYVIGCHHCKHSPIGDGCGEALLACPRRFNDGGTVCSLFRMVDYRSGLSEYTRKELALFSQIFGREP